MNKGISFICFLFTSFLFFAQSYPNNREKFVKDFQRMMSESGTAQKAEFVKKELGPLLLQSTEFPESYFTKMVETCNLMESKKLKASPEIYNYVYSVYSFVKRKQSNESYTAWHNSVDKMLDAKNIKKFEDFIEFSAGFFSENLLSEATAFKWYYTGGTYAFEYTDKPMIRFQGGKLKCLVANEGRNRNEVPFTDSIIVTGTSGTYSPLLKDWIGKEGAVDWQKVGLPKNEVSASLRSYKVDMKSPNLRVDSVLFTTPYFSKPIYGQFIDRAFKVNREEDKIYPQFTSFEKRLKIKNIREDVDYEGGFSMKGSSFIGVGTTAEPATLLIHKNSKPFIKVKSQVVNVTPKTIFSGLSQMTVLLSEKDSIYHPGLDFTFDYEKKTFEFTRSKTGIGQSPFSDSYHMLDIYVQKIIWVKGSSDLALTYGFEIGQEQRVARLESRNFFDTRLYDQLQGLETVHPLVAISNYCYKYDEYILTEGKMATALGKTIEQAKPLMLQLSGLGFITYDTESKMVVVNEKTMNFISAKSGKKDYDNLGFVSDMRPKTLQGYTPEQIDKDKKLQEMAAAFKVQSEARKTMKNFGTLNLNTLDLVLEAVDQVKISDPQNIAVFPEGNKVTIKKDRNFNFSGWINAGKMEIKSLDANYVYATNKINLLKTEIGVFRVRPLTEKDGKESISMGSALSGLVGEILVDAPTNRAGNKKEITDFPKLIVSSSTKVFYNDKSIYRGAYDTTRFYFTVAPFEMDSLDNFKEKSLRLKGELTSAGIFPKFKEELKIMPDYSFGFSTAAPTGGYDFYSTKAKYENKIVLSNNGLQGSGKIDFVQSTSVSQAFTFLPDSTVGYAKFTNKPVEAGVQFPDVTSDEAYITYVPHGNVLKAASTRTTPLSFFKGEGKLNGTAIVRPTGMTGFGIINLKDANLQSNNFKFKRWDSDADTATFNLKNLYPEPDEDPLSFKTDNVNAHVSFSDRKGVFKSNDGESTVEFPVNQYICKMDVFTWFMDQESVEMSQSGKKNINIDADLDLAKSNFFSIHPKQDSLQFRAPMANFSLKQKTIFCSKVEFLDVADARIFPDSMKVTIRKKAAMDPLNNSTIVANYITKYHRFIKGKTLVTARRAYTSEADYPYIDADSTVTIVHMDKIVLDSSYQTVATGKISSEANFKLSKQFDYYGSVKIQAANPLITFTGATRINHNCEKFPRNWMSFSSQIDPKNIQIPVSESMKTLDGIPVSAGIVWRDSRDADSVKLYPTFLSTLASPKDPIVITASGLLQYNFGAKEFQIASADKLVNRNAKGNFIALHTESCSMNGSGKINLGMDYADVSVDAVGVANYNQSNGQTTLNITARYNLPVDKGLFEAVATKINAIEGLKQLDFGSNTMMQAVTEWTDQKTADKIKDDYVQKGEVKRLPKELESGIVITGIRLSSYDRPDLNQTKGLITNVESAAIVNIFDKTVFKYVPFKAFYQQVYSENVSGDKFGLYISVPGGSDYFLDYAVTKKDGLLTVYTTDKDLESGINAMKEDKRKSKNFKYESTSNSAFLGIFMRLFE